MNTLRPALDFKPQPQATRQGAALVALKTNLSLLPATAGQAPAWVELIPNGPVTAGRDGQHWLFDEPAQHLVLSSFTARAVDLRWHGVYEPLLPR